MLGISHLKKVLVGSAFTGAFFLASPAVGAQELPQADIDSASEPFLPFVRPFVDIPRRHLIRRFYLHALD